jgi:hypothetical protein
MKVEVPLIVSDRLLLRLANQDDIYKIIDFYSDNQFFFTPWHRHWAEDFLTQSYWQKQVGCISLWRICRKRVKMEKLVKLPKNMR